MAWGNFGAEVFSSQNTEVDLQADDFAGGPAASWNHGLPGLDLAELRVRLRVRNRRILVALAGLPR